MTRFNEFYAVEADAVHHIRKKWISPNDGSAVEILVHRDARAVDGSSREVKGPNGLLLSRSETVLDPVNMMRTETVTNADDSRIVRGFVSGRLAWVEQLASDASVVGRVDYTYDDFGRLEEEVDARNGTTIYSYFDDGRLASLARPSPDGVAPGPVTTYAYTDLPGGGRKEAITHPDNTVTTREYYPTGELKREYGSRTYPVEYVYDHAGRRTGQITWQDYSGSTGEAETTWVYNDAGALVSKRYDDGKGPDYVYSAAGRLVARTWARGVTTTYTYTVAGELESVSYSDGTPGVFNTYHRHGRAYEVTDGTGTRTYGYDPDDLQLVSESHGTGPMDGLVLHRGYDALGRADLLEVSALDYAVGYKYDEAGRLETVTPAGIEHTYSYHPFSNLVHEITSREDAQTVLTRVHEWDYLNRMNGEFQRDGLIKTCVLRDLMQGCFYENEKNTGKWSGEFLLPLHVADCEW